MDCSLRAPIPAVSAPSPDCVPQHRRPRGKGQAQGALRPDSPARRFERAAREGEIVVVPACVDIRLIEGHRVGGGVVQARHEQGVGRDREAFLHEPRAQLPIVQQAGEKPSVHLARVAAAGAAVERARVRVIHDARTVPDEEHHPREAFRERHGAQHRLGDGDALRRAERRHQHGHGICRDRPTAEAERVAREAHRINRAHRLHEGERGDRSELEASLYAFRPRDVARGPILDLESL